jgi:LisH
MDEADSGMSAIDLKSRLIESLKTTGVVDEMKVGVASSRQFERMLSILLAFSTRFRARGLCFVVNVYFKAKLRAQFIQELRLRGEIGTAPSASRSVTIADRLVNSVVAEHMSVHKFDASTSVFLPESGYGLDCSGACLV